MLRIEDYVTKAQAMDASDIHLVCGIPVKYRIDGQLEDFGDFPLLAEDCQDLAKALCGEKYEDLMEKGELDFARTYDKVRCRIHVFKQQGIPSITLRLLREEIPVLHKLGLPPAVLDLARIHKGVVLVTGETGSGKSTTLASLLDSINHTRKNHIVTLEDPIEYIYKPDKCVINQREIGKDTLSFSEGLRASLREDPDVILIGEMRDQETIETALTAAETGHLVFGTLHTGSAADSIDRIVSVFPEGKQAQIRLQLSMCLQAVITQQLVPKRGGGRVLACEMMVVNDAIRNLIRSGNTPQIANSIATSEQIGGQSMDQALIRLYKSQKITKDTACEFAHDLFLVKKKTI